MNRKDVMKALDALSRESSRSLRKRIQDLQEINEHVEELVDSLEMELAGEYEENDDEESL